ncbi:MAG: hypothetical protein ABWW66_06400 [Archaeoglobaceae archaeon]
MRYCILLLFTTLLLGCLAPEEGSFTHEIDYRVSVTFGDFEGDAVKPPEIDEVENVTVIVPLPVLDEPIELANLSVPDSWKAELVETSYGKMLKLSGEKVRAWVMKPMPVPVEPGSNLTPTPTMVKRAARYDFELRLKLDREINTLSPLNGEYILKPKFSLREVECPEEYVKYWENAECYTYTTLIYYESEPFVDASVVVWLEGRNSWFQMGWTGNEFDDYISVQLTHNGWHNVTGKLETGQGVYLK